MSLSESIDKLAEEELLMEAKRGAARASTSGAFGWQKCPLPKTNKRFLRNTLLQSLQSNRSPPKVDQSKRSPKPEDKCVVEDRTVTSRSRELPKPKLRPRPKDKDEDSSRKKRRKDEKRKDERRNNRGVASPRSEKSKKQKSKNRDK